MWERFLLASRCFFGGATSRSTTAAESRFQLSFSNGNLGFVYNQVVEIPRRHITTLSNISFRWRQSGWQRVKRE
jgi:hypothetical protein